MNRVSAPTTPKGDDSRHYVRDPDDDFEGPIDRARGWREKIRQNKSLNASYRIGVAVVGTLIILAGLALVPLPGPGWLIVFAGLAILATEFAWAGRLLDFARAKVRTWTDWVTCQSLLVRAAIALGSLALIAGAVWAYLAAQGVPSWLPLS